jgi:nucleoside-diphosphate-sugar epimerase
MDSVKQLQVAITGAAGLVGSHLVDFLSDRGYPVTAVVRSRKSLGSLEQAWLRKQILIKEADLTDASSLDEAFRGKDIIVHAAGIVDPYGSRTAIFNTNVQGTQNAIAAAQANQVKHFILISSLSVITGRVDQFDTSEEAPYRRSGEAYADSKVSAEVLVREAIAKTNFPATIVRPGFIYGPRERAWMPRLINSIAAGKAMLIDGGLKETNVIYVQNLNRAVLAVIENSCSIGQIYNLTDGPGISKKQLFDAISLGLNLPPVKRHVPGFLARSFCEVISLVAPLLPPQTQKKLARYSKAAFRLAGQNQGFAIRKAEQELGYIDRIAFAEGMAETLKSFAEGRGAQLRSSDLVSGAR